MATNSSILNDVKKLIGLHESVTDFDLDLITHINSTFATLNQLGVGPDQTFSIEGDTEKWNDFTEDKALLSVRSYIVNKVRLAFDPPANSFTQEAIKEQIREYEFRLNVAGERDEDG